MFNSENNRYREEFFENSEMLISIYDKNLNLIDANPAFLKGLRFKKEDILGKNINDISPDCKSSGRYKIYEEIIRTGQPFLADQIRLHPSLGGIYIRLSAFRVGDGLGISSKDITDLVETIQELETFIYKTSHDIRSPIATSLGLINCAKLDLENQTEALRYLDMIKHQTERLDLIVTQLVETTRIRQGSKSLQLLDFGEVLDKVLLSFANSPGFSRIIVTKNISGTARFYSDPSLINTILQKLLDNSIKYRDENKTNCFITISCQSETDNCIITVEDNGVGIEEDVINDVFKMFFRGSSIAGGSGLGLYTVRNCKKKLCGQISCTSTFSKGTKFEIQLPNSMPAATKA